VFGGGLSTPQLGHFEELRIISLSFSTTTMRAKAIVMRSSSHEWLLRARCCDIGHWNVLGSPASKANSFYCLAGNRRLAE
jgi:hypothetical protein